MSVASLLRARSTIFSKLEPSTVSTSSATPFGVRVGIKVRVWVRVRVGVGLDWGWGYFGRAHHRGAFQLLQLLQRRPEPVLVPAILGRWYHDAARGASPERILVPVHHRRVVLRGEAFFVVRVGWAGLIELAYPIEVVGTLLLLPY